MVDKNYCMSSYLAFRYIERANVDFYEGIHHKIAKLPEESELTVVSSADEVDHGLKREYDKIQDENLGLLLSGGMDSACLAAYMPRGSNAYTFRFLGGDYASEELKRAEYFANINELKLHYIDITWDDVIGCLPTVMKKKAAPVHSIEPQIYLAAKRAIDDGITKMVIGDAADYVFYGMDQLLSKNWEFEEFVKRSIYIDPKTVLVKPADVLYLYKRYQKGTKIDFISFYDKSITEESYSSYENAFETAGLSFVDPYQNFKMSDPVNLKRIRNGDSKYYIRELYRSKYPDSTLPEKLPMPRLVDIYFKDWKGPTRPEFKKNINMTAFTGNQKWLLYCLEAFLDLFEGRG